MAEERTIALLLAGGVPPARTVPGESGLKSDLENSILGSGVVIAGGLVKHSVLSRHVRVHEAATVQDCVLFDHVRVGAGARLRNCIIDKHVRVPNGEAIGFDLEKDRERFVVSENGIVVVPRSYDFAAEPVRRLAPQSIAAEDEAASVGALRGRELTVA